MSTPMLTPEQLEKFDRDGYLVLPSFVSPVETTTLLEQARSLLENFTIPESMTRFTTKDSEKDKHVGDKYFLESGSDIRFFFEEGAVSPEGKLLPTYSKSNSINKIGHGLHYLDPVYRNFTLDNPRLKTLARELGVHKDPQVLQSMIICKNPKIGGKVPIHNDSTFLYTHPEPTAVGFWFALEPCTLTNGCLWFLPGSHKLNSGRIRERFVRLPDGGTGFETLLLDEPEPVWDESKFVAEPCEEGTLVLIHGSVIHKSEANRGDQSRFIYTFHMIESPEHGAIYDEKNWLQPEPGKEGFERLFDERS
ncbi:hypothetical protein BDY24DRAFT_394684 [Mrakia frigida]|uniref:phytanoyl-CoA dioxygenase family protein n=1 Tax=Mrakia frigida TaxID=29902 RepID=UPI003FCBF48B